MTHEGQQGDKRMEKSRDDKMRPECEYQFTDAKDERRALWQEVKTNNISIMNKLDQIQRDQIAIQIELASFRGRIATLSGIIATFVTGAVMLVVHLTKSVFESK